MDITHKRIDNILYVYMQGELDEFTAKYAREYLDEIILKEKYDEVVFDFSSLDFMDSTGIGVLIGRYKVLKSKLKNAYISKPNATIEKIINMSGIYEIMPKIS